MLRFFEAEMIGQMYNIIKYLFKGDSLAKKRGL